MDINFEDLLQQQRSEHFANKLTTENNIKQMCQDLFTVEFEKILLTQYLRDDWEVSFLLPQGLYDSKYHTKDEVIAICKTTIESLDSMSAFTIPRVSFAYQGIYKSFTPVLVVQVQKT